MSKTMNMQSGRVRLELDRGEVYPDDPGRGTPALVCIGRNTGTYWCVTDTGELIDGPKLTDSELWWLESKRDLVEEFLYGPEEEDE